MNNLSTKEESLFAAGVVFANHPVKKWVMLCATVDGFPIFQVKIVGGTNNECLSETSDQTLKRELKEEAKIEVIDSTLVHSFTVPGKISGSTHKKDFYLVKKYLGKFPIDYIHKFDDDGEAVTVKWWKVEEVENFIFKNHKDGFIKAFLEMANTVEVFKNDNLEIYNRLKDIKF